MANSISCYTPQKSFKTLAKSNLNRPSACYRPTIVAVAQSQTYWASVESEIENYLKKAIPIRSPESVFEPMHNLTFTAPRTTASALCVVACELVGGDRGQAMAAAAAIHLMHAAAYTHEHLPLTDRPKSTIQHTFGPNIELLTGDGIIPFGLELLARSMDLTQNNSDQILRVIIEITRTVGSQGIVDGQFHELELDDQLGSDNVDIIEYVSKKKEGELHGCGAACGAILGGGAEEEIEKLRNFGLYLGMIKGMMGRNKLGMEGKIEKLKVMALKELESFKGKKYELISELVELEPSLSAN